MPKLKKYATTAEVRHIIGLAAELGIHNRHLLAQMVGIPYNTLQKKLQWVAADEKFADNMTTSAYTHIINVLERSKEVQNGNDN